MYYFFDFVEGDGSAVELFFVQAKSDVVEQRYPCGEHDSITLAALLAQEEFGDRDAQDGAGAPARARARESRIPRPPPRGFLFRAPSL